MRCILCGGKTIEKIVAHAEFGVLIGDFKSSVCEKCGETYFDEKTAGKIQEKSKELGLFGLAKKVKVAEVGNSIAIRIPRQIAEFLSLRKGKDVILSPRTKHDLHIEV
ncbi:YgiT-type zinc finger protein [Candidatus Woesearchaeota archaeon]|nr:YgiT-type zinc finger protein [Candidatus Woesearchaeota archaeon]